MKVKTLVEMLQRDFDPEDSVIAAVWEKETFKPLLNDESDWPKVAQSCMDEVNWNLIHDEIMDHVQDYSYQLTQEKQQD